MKTEGPLFGRSAHRLIRGIIAGDFENCLARGFLFHRIKEPACDTIFDQIRRAARLRGSDRHTERHRFQDGHRTILLQRREDQESRSRQNLFQSLSAGEAAVFTP